jgi:hypothetical protein
MVVTGILDADQTKLLDNLSTKLDMLVQSLKGSSSCLTSMMTERPEALGTYPKLLTRGYTWIETSSQKQKTLAITYLTVRKNRFAHRTGPAGVLVFDPSTYIVSERGVLPT